MEAFERLEVWKRGSRLCVNLYRALAGCTEWAIRDQITRSALSVPSNIAEGYERGSSKEYVRFLGIAKGSCAELRTQLYIVKELGLIEAEAASGYIQETVEISRMLQGLIRSVNPL